MAVEQKPGARGVVEAKTGAVAEPWLKPKNNGSLIPPRRKLVKKMMLECIARFIASIFGGQGSPTSSGAAVIHGGSGQMMIPPPNPKAEKNVSKIHPRP